MMAGISIVRYSMLTGCLCCVTLGTIVAQNKKPNCPAVKDSLLHKFVYTQADKTAAPEGGIEGLYRVMAKNLRYPEDGTDYESRVIIAFVVEPNGKVDGKRVIKEFGTEKIFSKQLFKILDSIKWSPAICNGRAVPFLTMLPIGVGLSE